MHLSYVSHQLLAQVHRGPDYPALLIIVGFLNVQVAFYDPKKFADPDVLQERRFYVGLFFNGLVILAHVTSRDISRLLQSIYS